MSTTTPTVLTVRADQVLLGDVIVVAATPGKTESVEVHLVTGLKLVGDDVEVSVPDPDSLFGNRELLSTSRSNMVVVARP